MGDLSENSKAYYNNNDYYEIFSQAEDYPNLINKKLKKYIKEQKVLDAGCGTGKYSKTIIKNAKSYLGIDKSIDQIEKAKKKVGDKFFQIEDLSELKLEENSFDTIVSCWCLGTIPENKRNVSLENLKKVAKNKIVLIENLPNSEFETIRGHDKDGKTEEYLKWLKNNGFILQETVETYFMFDNSTVAKEVFEVIYNKSVSDKITSNIINHKVGIFVWRK